MGAHLSENTACLRHHEQHSVRDSQGRWSRRAHWAVLGARSPSLVHSLGQQQTQTHAQPQKAWDLPTQPTAWCHSAKQIPKTKVFQSLTEETSSSTLFLLILSALGYTALSYCINIYSNIQIGTDDTMAFKCFPIQMNLKQVYSNTH